MGRPRTDEADPRTQKEVLIMNKNTDNLINRLMAYAERIAEYRSWKAIEMATHEAECEGFHVDYVESFTYRGRGVIAPHVTVEDIRNGISATVDLAV